MGADRVISMFGKHIRVQASGLVRIRAGTIFGSDGAFRHYGGYDLCRHAAGTSPVGLEMLASVFGGNQ
jgi:hypothetical protein